MKISRLVVRTLLAASLAATTLACGSPKAPPVAAQPPAADPLVTADGHFAASRTYQGECMPAGSRGGCYSITLEPDGSYRHVLLDAPVTGTYAITGDDVHLTPSGDLPPATMTLSADRSHLGDYVYQPPAPETAPTAP
ncbi:MAG: hypothetical protein K8W52_03805 [Deltaproteobacteria bacterium]|nr:hypothetical protein [Deltaproteobacteria bacterium]